MHAKMIFVALLSLCTAGLLQAQTIPETATSIESYDMPGYFMISRDSTQSVRLVEGGDQTPEGQWNLVTGLAGTGTVSFMPVALENHYMRHRSYILYCDPAATDDLFRGDASFTPRPGLADPTNPKLVSFESQNFPGRFLIHGAAGDTIGFRIDPITTTEQEARATFMFPAGAGPYASEPIPADEATDVRPDIVMGWTPGAGAVSHDVYFGQVFDDVNTATTGSDLFLGNQADALYNPADLIDLGGTYYWRVDEVNNVDPNSPYKGEVWSFTIEAYSSPVPDVNATTNRPVVVDSEPNKMVDGSGLLPGGGHSNNDKQMWEATIGDDPNDSVVIDFAFDRLYKIDEVRIWNHNHQWEAYLNFGVKNVSIEYAAYPDEWVALGDFDLTAFTGSTTQLPDVIDFGGVAAQYVRFTINSNFGSPDNVGLSEVRFMYIPTFAREPVPTTGIEGVTPDVELSWRPGREVVTHQIHLGTDPNAVADGLSLAAISNTPSYDGTLLNLQLGEKYYWMITEVNNSATPTSWNSAVWDFNMAEYIVVDDMESYDDEENRIYTSWIDGLDFPAENGGSQVGPDDPPYAEQSIVHSGKQSMLFQFGRNGAAFSQAKLTLSPAQNWKLGGAKTLVVWFRGRPGNATPQLYAKINNGAQINYTGSAASLAAPVWKQWNINLSSLAVTSVSSLTLGVSGSGAGTMYFDDIRLYNDAGPQTGNAVDPGTANLKAYYPMSDSVADASGSGYNGTAETGATFGNGPTGYGRALVLDGATGYVTLPIGPLVQTMSDATVGTWVNWAGSGSQWCRIFDFGTGTTNYMFLTPNSGGSSLRFSITKGDGESFVEHAGILSAGWHYVAVTVESATMTMKLYLDGEMVGSATTETLPQELGNTDLNYLGKSQWDDPYLSGSLDEFRIYNRVLSGSEIGYLAGDR